VVAALVCIPRSASASCAAPANAIEAENCLPGVAQSTWDVSGSGDSTIQGFATDISVNKGTAINFKVNTPASAWHLDIYRMGYYGGNGARLITTVNSSAPQNQPACLTNSTGLIDCGNWAVSASWTVPATAVSGIYFARAIRNDTGGASHIFFIVRDDASHSAILFQTSDTTWQAYNDYGGNSLYTGNGAVGRAYKVSYNRPFNTRVAEAESWVFNGEYPMVRWIERNGYDVTYSTGVDADRNGSLLLNHRVWMSNGHDEYWSGGERANVEAARTAGVHLAVFSGNTMFWKTRWENSIDSSGTAYRTLVCYKETHANAVIDPLDPPTWTGTWRDPRFSPPADGGRPENALTGLLFRVNGPFTSAITVPQADGRMRLWRNTSVATLAAGQTATLAPGTLGAEVNVDEDNGFRPPGLLGMSTNAISTTTNWLLDFGSTYGAGSGTHRITLYKHSSGALVFATGSYQWSWGLDANHDRSSLGSTTDVRMQQATVNLLADMGVQPATLQAGLTAASASTDTLRPTSSITSPAGGATLQQGTAVTISGTATDTGGGVVGGVEVSVDGGATWHPATGRGSWTFAWTPSASGAVTIKSRAVDDSGNLETPGAGISVTVSGGSSPTIWASSVVPGVVDQGPDSSVELGVKFRSDVSGTITGVRFYKAGANTGTHTGTLWTSAGTKLATATFTGETSSGWQQVSFATPVSIAANTVYVASYHCNNGHYSADSSYFTSRGVDSSPLHALASGVSGGNGVYAYGSTTAFPTSTYQDTNYWVDVVFASASLTSIAVAPASPTIGTGATQQFSATGTFADGSTQDITSQVSWTSSNTAVATIGASGLATGVSAGTSTIQATQGSVVGSATLTVQAAALSITTTSLPAGSVNSSYSATLQATGGTRPYSWSTSGTLPPGLVLNASTGAITGTPTTIGSYNFTATVTDAASATASTPLSIQVAVQELNIFANAPVVVDDGPDSPVELGVKFRSDSNGTIRGIRFYKSAANTGTHVGSLWTTTGTKLASATFTAETASGWQRILFASPVSITANTVYIASYHTDVGHYAGDANFFSGKGVDNPPLHALADGVSGGDGVYAYGPAGTFPNQTYAATNYWVDVVASTSAPPTLTSITVTPANPSINSGSTLQLTATGNYSDGSTQNLTTSVLWTSSDTGTATISAAGVLAGFAVGTAQISAASGAITASTTVTVQAAPLTITTTSLPDARSNATYSASLAASGGAVPYAWSISAGALPAGLSLNSSTGAISGTPTTTGTSTFTARVTDSKAQSATANLSINVINSANYSLWPSSTAPSVVDGGPDSSVELGVRFTADASGTITAIRFYKASANTGSHVGTLWSSTGTKLATATFTNETASGWQQVNFPTPVAITTGTTYIASYHTTVGHYSADTNYFAKAWDNMPLHAAAGVNGVYAYGATSVFPNNVYQATNYWVDVVFNSAWVPPALTSIAVSPASPSVALGASLQLTATGTYADGSTHDITAQATWTSASSQIASVNASGVVLGLRGGTSAIMAAAGGVSGTTTLTVTTPPPPPDDGPGGPILVVSSAANPVTRYLAEILRAEGMNEFLATDISRVTATTLAAYDVVLLGDFALTSAQVSMFSNWVNSGGNLIAMRPDRQLSTLLGLADAGATVADGYLRISQTGPGFGIVNQTIQFHGPADAYSTAGASVIATLYQTATVSTPWPAVTLSTSGSGSAAAFTYDLARSVVYTRQGNPAWSGEERDGTPPIRPDDLYFGAAASDPEPDYVDFSKIQIPQADEQQRLLVNLILAMNGNKKPLPRFWYLPSGFLAAVVMTGDDHANGGTAGRFDTYVSKSPPSCSVADWQCVRSTSYIYPNSPLTNTQATNYIAQGFEVAFHPTTGCVDFVSFADLDSYFQSQLASFKSRYPGAGNPVTNRTHCLVWSDYDTHGKVELSHGMRFDANYYYWPGSWINDRPGLFTGSGLPMRFADRFGNTIDVYQSPTQITDESGQTYLTNIDTLLDNAIGPNGYYTVVTANMHTDTVASAGSDTIVAEAQARGVPIVSSKQMLTWLDGRNGSSFGGFTWSSNILGFTISTGTGARNIQAMVPAQFGGLTLSGVKRAGVSVTYTLQTIKGVSYAQFNAVAGSYQVTYH
jgi:uncharacterized protein YjdB